MFSIGLVIAAVSFLACRILTSRSYVPQGCRKLQIAAGCFVAGTALMVGSVAIIAWRWLP